MQIYKISNNNHKSELIDKNKKYVTDEKDFDFFAQLMVLCDKLIYI